VKLTRRKKKRKFEIRRVRGGDLYIINTSMIATAINLELHHDLNYYAAPVLIITQFKELEPH